MKAFMNDVINLALSIGTEISCAIDSAVQTVKKTTKWDVVNLLIIGAMISVVVIALYAAFSRLSSGA